jgi:hypothetical protein
VICLAWPSFSPTTAGLLSFTLAPLGMLVGSLLFPERCAIAGCPK